MEPTETELLRRSCDGDAEAFGLLVDRHKNRMVNYLVRLTGCRDRPKTWPRRPSCASFKASAAIVTRATLRPISSASPPTWCAARERRKKRWQLLVPLVLPSRKSTKGPQDDAIANEEQRQVLGALADIELTFRAPLVLREIEGRSYLEIAEVLGVSEGTVKSRLHRGRRLLKEKLTPYWQGARAGSPHRETPAFSNGAS